MNKVILLGRLVRNPELKTTQTGKSTTSFTLAVDRKFKQDGGPQADFITCVAWGKTAEIIAQYMTKGRQIAIDGSIQTRSYEGKNGKVFVTEVLVDSFDFVGDKGSSGASAKPTKAATEQQSTLDDDFFLMSDDDDLPF